MPTWDEILQVTTRQPALEQIDYYLSKMSEYTGHTTICYISAFSVIRENVPQPFHSIVDQDMQAFMTCSNKVSKDCLDLIIHTPGGDYEATKRLIYYLHSIYKYIRVFVPHLAMSGGTLIACAADEIWMGPYSSLGPTDPQILLEDKYIPIGAIINEFERAFAETIENPKKALIWTTRLNMIPSGLYAALENMRDNSNEYLKELLLKRNCKGMTERAIEDTVRVLNGFKYHTSHGRGLTIENAKNLNLNVRDLKDDDTLEDFVLSIYHSCTIFFQTSPAQKIIANNKQKRYIINYNPPR